MAWNFFDEIVYRLEKWDHGRQLRKQRKAQDDQFLRMVSGGNDDLYRKLKKAVKKAK